MIQEALHGIHAAAGDQHRAVVNLLNWPRSALLPVTHNTENSTPAKKKNKHDLITQIDRNGETLGKRISRVASVGSIVLF